MNIAKYSRLLLRSVGVAALLSCLAVTSGCFLVAVGAAGAAGAGTVAFVEGKLVATLNAAYDDTGRATGRALAQLQLVAISDQKDAFTNNFLARTADDKKVTIVLTKQADNLTKVEIRVGTFGDKGISMSILDKIRANL